MKIMSLNVNQFLMLRLSSESWAKKIIERVKGFLEGGNDNLVFLYEVPYGRYGASDLFKDFEKEFDSYKMYHWGKEGKEKKAYFCTVAITNENNGWSKVEAKDSFKVEENKKEIFQNRYIELEHKDKQLQVLGVHASLDGTVFLETLKEYVIRKKETKFMVLGDLNCHMGEESSHKPYLKEMAEHIPDLIPDTEITFFPSGKAIDHVLVSPALKGEVPAPRVIPQNELELSDHAVIIVDIEE